MTPQRRQELAQLLDYTASGFSYHEEALKAVLDEPSLHITLPQRFVIERRLKGAQHHSDGWRLQEIAIHLRTSTSQFIDLPQLKLLWEDLGDVPVYESGLLEAPFQHFPTGTPREEVWTWFEAMNPEFSVAEAQGRRTEGNELRERAQA